MCKVKDLKKYLESVDDEMKVFVLISKGSFDDIVTDYVELDLNNHKHIEVLDNLYLGD